VTVKAIAARNHAARRAKIRWSREFMSADAKADGNGVREVSIEGGDWLPFAAEAEMVKAVPT
jgi:hypothetical protein